MRWADRGLPVVIEDSPEPRHCFAIRDIMPSVQGRADVFNGGNQFVYTRGIASDCNRGGRIDANIVQLPELKIVNAQLDQKGRPYASQILPARGRTFVQGVLAFCIGHPLRLPLIVHLMRHR